jgi:hypothetical protein
MHPKQSLNTALREADAIIGWTINASLAAIFHLARKARGKAHRAVI